MEKIISLKVERSKYSLELTFYPSFILTMFIQERGYWVKKCGYARGLKIRQVSDFLEVSVPCDVDEDLVYEISGLWFNPERYLSDVDGRYVDFAQRLVECASMIRIAVSRRDPVYIFISTFLSRNTDYYTNVIRWVQAICDLTCDKPESVSMSIIRKISRSYQLEQLPEALNEFLESVLRLYLEGASYWEIRRELLKIRNVGPKVADAFLIFTGMTTELAPSDIHFRRFVKRARIFEDFTVPDKKYCVRYTCDECPRRSCLTGLSHRVFGRLSSWIQTVSYVIDRLYCSKDKCSTCPLSRKVCNVKT